MNKYFGINYDDPGVVTRFKREDEIAELEWLKAVYDGTADVFRVEVDSTGVLQVRRALVEVVEPDEEEEGEDVKERLEIEDWELVV